MHECISNQKCVRSAKRDPYDSEFIDLKLDWFFLSVAPLNFRLYSVAMQSTIKSHLNTIIKIIIV